MLCVSRLLASDPGTGGHCAGLAGRSLLPARIGCNADLSFALVNHECLSISLFRWVGHFLVLCMSLKCPLSKVESTSMKVLYSNSI